MHAVEFRNIGKKFGDYSANDDISFAIGANTVHYIAGENGAGKSTLMNILFGLCRQDSGTVSVFGETVNFRSPHDAIAMKIGMVHQHFMLIDDFTVFENVILGMEPVRGFQRIDEAGGKRKLQELIDEYSLGLDPDARAGDLGISMQQKVEILKLLYRESMILIFDEPTAVLSPSEVDSFLTMTSNFRSAGKTVIVISHKLKELERSADKVSVLRKGRLVFEASAKESKIDIDAVSRAIVGEAEIPKPHAKTEPGFKQPVLLSMKNVTYVKDKRRLLDGLSLELAAGEIHGIAGVEGNGQSELADIVCGVEKDFEGDAEPSEISAAIVPDDRHKKGMIREFSVAENLLLKRKGLSFHTGSTLRADSINVMEEFDIRAPDPDVPSGSLSGGNQQKAVIAREILSDEEIIVFAHPSRGVDISASAFIASRIIDERNRGKAVLLISSDIEELLALSDRISVMYKGRIVRTLPGELIKKCAGEEGAEYRERLMAELGRAMTGVEK
ncbi:MAG: ABC transporter ATP-binding protein [Ignavibacteria bacterium]|nr:ABC transporter ATP-binding protein [Ignavibacteria bacterium]